MNTHTDITDDELDARLRDTFATVMPLLAGRDTPSASDHTGQAGEIDHDPLEFDLATAPTPRRHRRTGGILGAAAAVALVVGGLTVAQRDRSEAPAVAGSPLPSVGTNTSPAPATSEIGFDIAEPVASVPLSCDGVDGGPCRPFERLPVLNDATDFYVGPEQLGTPVVALEFFDQLVRCTTLDADGQSCIKIEGIAGVGLTRYPSDVTVDTTFTESASALDVEIGTTFADISPTDYANQWGSRTADDGAVIDEVEVRGRQAVTFSAAGSQHIVWVERPGVLVWVKASNDAPDDLLAIANSVRRVPGPESIPWIVSVPDDKHGQTFDASSNDADTLVVGRETDGDECVGLGFIESTCQGSIGEQTFVKIIDDRALVTGIAPTTVTTVRISQNGQVLAETPIRPIDASTSLLFSEYVDAEGAILVEWIDPSGVIAFTEPEIDFCRTACG